MKKLITNVALTVLALSIFSSLAFSQTPGSVPDLIEANRITLKPTTNSQQAFQLAGTPSKLIEVFGPPETTSNAFSEMNDTTINRYNFKDMEAFFEGKKLISLKIKGEAVTVQLNGKTIIKTGDHISTLGTLFPHSYALKKDGQMLVGFKLADGTPTDTGIDFWFDENGVITGIVM